MMIIKNNIHNGRRKFTWASGKIQKSKIKVYTGQA
jgi:hypothetical protein